MKMDSKPMLKRIAKRFRGPGRITGWLARGCGSAVESSGLGFDADEWAALILISAAAALLFSLAPLLLIFPPLQALGIALACGISAALGVYAVPFIAASRNSKATERELPMFLARLLAAYSEKGDMAAALRATIYSFDGRLAAKAREAFAEYLAGADAAGAFSGLIEKTGSRYVGRAFALVSKSLEAGLDVGNALEDVARGTAASIEFEAEKESRTGLISWVISASSAFFFPLFAALGLVMMGVLEKIASLSPYTQGERGFIEVAVLVYLFAGVALDAGYNGRMRLGSFGKGVLAFTAPLAMAALLVFVLAFKLAGSMTGT